MVAKDGNMPLSVLRCPTLHLLHFCDIYCVYCRTVEDTDVSFAGAV